MTLNRFGYAVIIAIAAPAWAEPPKVTSPTPKIRLAQVADGTLILEDVWAISENTTQTRTITEDGVTRTVTVVVPVRKLRSQREVFALKEVKAFDMDGRQVTPGRMEHILKERAAVVIVHDASRLDAAYRRVLRDDALILVVPDQPVP